MAVYLLKRPLSPAEEALKAESRCGICGAEAVRGPYTELGAHYIYECDECYRVRVSRMSDDDDVFKAARQPALSAHSTYAKIMGYPASQPGSPIIISAHSDDPGPGKGE